METWNAFDSSIICLRIANISRISSQKLNKKRKLNRTVSFAMYGIVTTAKSWVFLRWTGSFENPLIEISREYNCGDFFGDMNNSKLILHHIIRVLLSAIESVDALESEVPEDQEDETLESGLSE